MVTRFVVREFIQLWGWPKRYRVLDTLGVIAPNEYGVFERKQEAVELCEKLNTQSKNGPRR